MNKILILILIINILSFFLMGLDKLYAQKNYWRIAENVLIGIAILGGASGSLLGMLLFHHKTKKKKFQLGIPLCIFMNIYFYRQLI